MRPLPLFVGVLVYLTAIFLDVTIFFLMVRSLAARFHGELMTALDRAGEPLVTVVSRRAQRVVAWLGGRQVTEQAAQVLALVFCAAMRTAISYIVVGSR
jgi:hypothetical protein